jgi:hypothetical protein
MEVPLCSTNMFVVVSCKLPQHIRFLREKSRVAAVQPSPVVTDQPSTARASRQLALPSCVHAAKKAKQEAESRAVAADAQLLQERQKSAAERSALAHDKEQELETARQLACARLDEYVDKFRREVCGCLTASGCSSTEPRMIPGECLHLLRLLGGGFAAGGHGEQLHCGRCQLPTCVPHPDSLHAAALPLPCACRCARQSQGRLRDTVQHPNTKCLSSCHDRLHLASSPVRVCETAVEFTATSLDTTAAAC